MFRRTSRRAAFTRFEQIPYYESLASIRPIGESPFWELSLTRNNVPKHRWVGAEPNEGNQ